MLSKRGLFLVCLLLIAGSLVRGEDADLARAKVEAGKRWKENLRSVSPLDSPHLKTVFKDTRCFRAVVFNPISQVAGRPTFDHAVLLREDGPVFVEDDAAAAAAISKPGVAVADPAEALSRVLAFAASRGYTLRLDRERATSWDLTVQQTEEGWAILCVLLVDPNIHACQRYEIVITRRGALTAKQGKVVCGNGYD
jgi:hypothetical protein